jgi:DNA mismatch repair protein MSH6
MTDRVNMRMVGVPEMSFDYWTAQFIAKGYNMHIEYWNYYLQ